MCYSYREYLMENEARRKREEEQRKRRDEEQAKKAEKEKVLEGPSKNLQDDEGPGPWFGTFVIF